MPPLLADFIHARGCKPICEKSLTLPDKVVSRIFRKLRPVNGLIFGIRFLCSVRQTGIYCFASPQYHKYIEYTSIAISPITNRTFTLIINTDKRVFVNP